MICYFLIQHGFPTRHTAVKRITPTAGAQNDVNYLPVIRSIFQTTPVNLNEDYR